MGEVRQSHETAYTLNQNSNASGRNTPMIAFKAGNGSNAGGIGASSEVSPSLTSAESGTNQVPAIAFSAKDSGADAGDVAPTMRSMGHDASHANGGRQLAIATPLAVRRLKATECERLQGFPDDYTQIRYRRKRIDQCPDGPRYKALGNSMSTNVMEWIGRRIQMVEDMFK